MKKFTLEDRISIYNDFHNGESYQGLSRKYEMNFSNLRYMIKFIDKYGWDTYNTPNNYSDDLKIFLVQRVLNKEDTLFNIALEGGLKSRTILQKWIRQYNQNGYNIVRRKRGPSMPKKTINSKTNPSLEEENRKLKEENEYLKAQLEYSKKLRAVVQSRKNRQQQKK